MLERRTGLAGELPRKHGPGATVYMGRRIAPHGAEARTESQTHDKTRSERSMREVEKSALDAMNAAHDLSVTTGRQLVHSLAGKGSLGRVMGHSVPSPARALRPHTNLGLRRQRCGLARIRPVSRVSGRVTRLSAGGYWSSSSGGERPRGAPGRAAPCRRTSAVGNIADR